MNDLLPLRKLCVEHARTGVIRDEIRSHPSANSSYELSQLITFLRILFTHSFVQSPSLLSEEVFERPTMSDLDSTATTSSSSSSSRKEEVGEKRKRFSKRVRIDELANKHYHSTNESLGGSVFYNSDETTAYIAELVRVNNTLELSLL